MKWLATACALVALALMPLAAQAEGRVQKRMISVSGSGEAAAVPDTAMIQVGVVTHDKTAAAALKKNSAAMRSVFDTLARHGVAERDMQTVRLQLTPEYEPRDKSNEREPLKVIGYRADNGLSVTLRDLALLGLVLDDLVSEGANVLQGISFTIADTDALADDARRRAMEDARRRATIYAETAGVTLGPVIAIEEQGAYLPQPRPMQAVRAMAAESVPIAGGESAFRVDLLVRFAIE